MTAIQRLTEQLDAKDAELSEMQDKLSIYEDSHKDAWQWTKHRKLTAKQTLPVPRLELRASTIDGDWANFQWHYSLIYKHLLGDIIAVPLGHTRCNGSRSEPPINNGEIYSPFRDGAHIQVEMQSLRLPAFLVVEEPNGKEMAQPVKIFNQRKDA